MKIKKLIVNLLNKIRYQIFINSLQKRYMNGVGAEIGAGLNPISPSDRTTYCDKYALKGVKWETLICEAHELPFNNEVLDYVASAHMLEHVPNPLKVIREWLRCLKNAGKLVIVLPHGDRTFDKGRKFTEYEHLLSDFYEGVEYGDPTHQKEFMSISATGRKHFWEANLTGNPHKDWEYLSLNRHIHYHVWDQAYFAELCMLEG